MTIKNILIAVFIATVWGMNFISVKFAFQEMPPFLFLTFRFIFTLFPIIFFLPKPAVSWRTLIWLGLFQWVLHFSLLFSGLYVGVPVGISSLLAQSQIIFTILFACIYFNSRLTFNQILGVVISFVGLALIALQDGIGANWFGYLLILGGAVAVGVSNILYRQISNVNMLSMIVWSTLPALPPMMLLTFMIEGWESIYTCCTHLSWVSISSLTYTIVISTFFGFALWAKLMNQCDPAKVAPFALLIPVVAMTASLLILDEVLTNMDILASILVLTGLVINQIRPRLKSAPVEALPIAPEIHHTEDVKQAA